MRKVADYHAHIGVVKLLLIGKQANVACNTLKPFAERVRHTVNNNFFVPFLHKIFDNGLKMTVSGEDNIGADIVSGCYVLINLIKHNKIRHIFFAILRCRAGFDNGVGDVAQLCKLLTDAGG